MIGFGASGNYFSRRDFYKWDMNRGVIRERGGARVMAFPQEFTVGLIAGLMEECGEAWPVVMQSCGAYWGQRQMERIEQELSTFYASRLKSVPTAAVHAAISESFAVHGWGRVQFDLTEYARRVLLVRVEGSVTAKAIVDGGIALEDRTGDALLVGAFAAMFSHASGVPMECKEISCVARGDSQCEFIIATEGRLAHLPTLIRRRTSRSEILQSCVTQ
jgi:hypothetical protein